MSVRGEDAPMGVTMWHVPRLDADEEAAVNERFAVVLRSFEELEAEGEPALRLITKATYG